MLSDSATLHGLCVAHLDRGILNRIPPRRRRLIGITQGDAMPRVRTRRRLRETVDEVRALRHVAAPAYSYDSRMRLALPTLLLLAAAAAHADPLRSPVWAGMHQRLLDNAPVAFDARVQVAVPAHAENPLAVPVKVRWDGLQAERVLVFADLNPIPRILDYHPGAAGGALALRLKVEQSTPVRAAVRTPDGRWHVGGAWLSAAGGGCTMPSQGSGNAAWQERLGEVSARLWPRADGTSRLRLRVMHPMDTGLAGGIPVFHVDRLALRDAQGRELARLQLFEPVAENPVLSLDLRHQGPLRIEGRDTQGNRIDGEVRP